MKSAVSSKGQVTLPAKVRQKLALPPGTPVRFEFRRVLLRKGTPGRHPVDQLFGRLKLAKSVDALLNEMRGSRPAAGARPARRASARAR